MKYLEPAVVVDPRVCCRHCRLLPLRAFHPTIQALINKMMCHPADQLSSCAGPRKPMGFLAPEPTDQSSREQLHFPSLSSPSFTDILPLSCPPPQVYPLFFLSIILKNFPTILLMQSLLSQKSNLLPPYTPFHRLFHYYFILS